MRAKKGRREAELSRVVAGEQSLRETCERLGLSYRPGERVFQRYRERGAQGLVHRSRSRPPNSLGKRRAAPAEKGLGPGVALTI